MRVRQKARREQGGAGQQPRGLGSCLARMLRGKAGQSERRLLGGPPPGQRGMPLAAETRGPAPRLARKVLPRSSTTATRRMPHVRREISWPRCRTCETWRWARPGRQAVQPPVGRLRECCMQRAPRRALLRHWQGTCTARGDRPGGSLPAGQACAPAAAPSQQSSQVGHAQPEAATEARTVPTCHSRSRDNGRPPEAPLGCPCASCATPASVSPPTDMTRARSAAMGPWQGSPVGCIRNLSTGAASTRYPQARQALDSLCLLATQGACACSCGLGRACLCPRSRRLRSRA